MQNKRSRIKLSVTANTIKYRRISAKFPGKIDEKTEFEKNFSATSLGLPLQQATGPESHVGER
jgi:hypothetical protein